MKGNVYFVSFPLTSFRIIQHRHHHHHHSAQFSRPPPSPNFMADDYDWGTFSFLVGFRKTKAAGEERDHYNNIKMKIMVQDEGGTRAHSPSE